LRFLEEGLFGFPDWPEPCRAEESLSVNGVERSEPENLLGYPGNGGADRMQSPLGVCNDEHPEAGLLKLAFVLS
jgi:hypothetical protein